jgi:hypothetical protein
VKIKPADTWFSKCVRERSDWVCECCGKQYEENSQGLHCSHHFSRRHRSVRWCGDNASSHCFSCHQRLGGNPVEFARWIENKLGNGLVQILEDKKNTLVKISKLEEKEIADHYKAEYKKLKERRKNGETGFIEFESYQ